MDVSKRNRTAHALSYPKNADEWREAVSKALNLTPEKGKARLQAGTFPSDDLVSWIYQEFSSDKGYSPDFIPALIRNRRGLIKWIYGNGAEPYWQGQDENKC